MQPSKDGALIGQKGVVYGLQKPAGKQAAGKKVAQPAAPRRPPNNVFGDDDSEEEDVEAQIARQADKKRSAQKVQQMYEAALADDPSVFDYDGVYDSIQEARTNPRQQEKIQRHSKYISQLKEQADQRKREQDIRFERKLLKERAAEDALYDDKEKFVTSAYRRKLEEDKKWAEEQARKDEEDERNDVRKLGHMQNFYGNLLTKNVAMGAKQVSRSQSPEAAEPGQQREGSAGPAAKSPSPAALHQVAGVVPGKAPVLDKYDMLRLEAERARRQQLREQQPGEAQQGQAELQAAGTGQQEQQQQSQPPLQAAEQQGAEEAPPHPGASGAPSADTSGTNMQPVAALQAGKRRNDETSVLSARERYLARKKQAVG